MIEDDLVDQINWWEDEDFITNLDMISNKLKNGTDRGVGKVSFRCYLD